MIKVEIVGVDKVTAKLKRIPVSVIPVLERDIGKTCLKILVKVKQEKLTGQVLHVRTGRLRRSIHQEVSSTPTSVTGIVGTNVQYAAVHEYGFTGVESVREHLRRAISGKQFPVRAFTRRVHFPERSFLRSVLKEMTPEIQQDLTAALRRIL